MDAITPAIGILGIIVGLPVAFIALHWWLYPERRLSWRRAREASGDADRRHARSSLVWWPIHGGGGGGDGGGWGDSGGGGWGDSGGGGDSSGGGGGGGDFGGGGGGGSW